MKNGEKLYILLLLKEIDTEDFVSRISGLKEAYEKSKHIVSEELEDYIDTCEYIFEKTKQIFSERYKYVSWQDELNGLEENYNEISKNYAYKKGDKEL